MTVENNMEQESSQIPTINNELNPYQDILGKNITAITHYNIRNRKIDSTNPFFITKGKNFLLGALTANVPGDTRKEQLLYLTNTFKLPKNSDLINFKF